jgi:hypothetical protein
MGRKNKKTAMKQRNLLMAVIRETLNEGVPILTHPLFEKIVALF